MGRKIVYINMDSGGIYRRYINLIYFLFLAFVFGTLSFGRSFSILHINFYGFKVFVTEIFLLISSPLILWSGRSLLRVPVVFRFSFILFFLLGLCHFLVGIFSNLFVLRDIVLWVYPLFLPLAYRIFYRKTTFVYFLIILLVSNLINLFIGKFLITGGYLTLIFKSLTEHAKFFNLGLYYGISLSFLLAFIVSVSDKKQKLLIILLVILNTYMLIFSSIRTLWVALLMLFIYFIFVQKRFFAKAILRVIFIVLPVCFLLFYVDSMGNGRNNQGMLVIAKIKTIAAFIFHKPRERQAPQAAQIVPLKPESKQVPQVQVAAPASGSLSVSTVSPTHAYFDERNIGTIVWRFEIWKQSIQFGLRSPWLGRGFGVYPHYQACYDPYNPAYSRRFFLDLPKRFDINSGVTPAHNHLVTVFFKMGLIGLALFIVMNVCVFRYGLMYIRQAKDRFLKYFLIGSLGAFVFWHTMALLFDVIDSPSTSLFLWIIMGLIFTVIEIDKNSLELK